MRLEPCKLFRPELPTYLNHDPLDGERYQYLAFHEIFTTFREENITNFISQLLSQFYFIGVFGCIKWTLIRVWKLPRS